MIITQDILITSKDLDKILHKFYAQTSTKVHIKGDVYVFIHQNFDMIESVDIYDRREAVERLFLDSERESTEGYLQSICKNFDDRDKALRVITGATSSELVKAFEDFMDTRIHHYIAEELENNFKDEDIILIANKIKEISEGK